MNEKKYSFPETEPVMASEPAVAISRPSVGYYWDMLRDLSSDTKVMLINLLAHSLATNATTKVHTSNLAKCFGSWNVDITPADIMNEVDMVCADKNDFINKYL